METVEIVIKIPKDDYEDIKENGFNGYSDQRNLIADAIANGTELPEGHGKLVDLGEMVENFWDGNSMEIHEDDLSKIHAIVDADEPDKEEEKEL